MKVRQGQRFGRFHQGPDVRLPDAELPDLEKNEHACTVHVAKIGQRELARAYPCYHPPKNSRKFIGDGSERHLVEQNGNPHLQRAAGIGRRYGR